MCGGRDQDESPLPLASLLLRRLHDSGALFRCKTEYYKSRFSWCVLQYLQYLILGGQFNPVPIEQLNLSPAFHGDLLPGDEPRAEVEHQHTHRRGDQDPGMTGFFDLLLNFGRHTLHSQDKTQDW